MQSFFHQQDQQVPRNRAPTGQRLGLLFFGEPRSNAALSKTVRTIKNERGDLQLVAGVQLKIKGKQLLTVCISDALFDYFMYSM